MGTVHVSCLEEWLTGSTRDSCELCSAPFNVVRTRKYSCFTSAYLFLRQHTNGLKLLRDLFFLAVSVMNTSILFFMWLTYVFRDFLRISGKNTPLSSLLLWLFHQRFIDFSKIRFVLVFIKFHVSMVMQSEWANLLSLLLWLSIIYCSTSQF